MKPAASGSGQRIWRVVTFPQCGAFISLTTYEVGSTKTTIATCPYTLYVPPGRYTAIAPTDGKPVVATPRACAFASQSPAFPYQVTRRLCAAHHVHWPNGKWFG